MFVLVYVFMIKHIVAYFYILINYFKIKKYISDV